MADENEQRRLQALLRFTATAGSHGNDTPGHLGGTVSAEDRAWLNEAVMNFTSDQFDPVQYIKEQLSKVFRYLKKNEDDESDTDLGDVYNALEEISDNCDQYDLAADLHKVGGFDVLIQCMRDQDSGVCWRACDVLATASQNHEYCQSALLEMKALPIILKLVENASADKKVREKAFYALSCLVRSNQNIEEHMEKNDVFSVLIRAIQSDVPKLKIKSTFLIKALCEDNPKFSSILHERGTEQQIIGMLRERDVADNNPESLTSLEGLLGCLYALISTCDECRKDCQDASCNLPALMRQLKEKFSAGGDEYTECTAFCDKISETCFRDDDDEDDR